MIDEKNRVKNVSRHRPFKRRCHERNLYYVVLNGFMLNSWRLNKPLKKGPAGYP
jgi:hypothetical protein